MKFTEILQELHRMQKDTSRLLFEAPVNESETIRKAVAKADLALGNAASLVRQQLCGGQGSNGACSIVGQGGRDGKASSQKITRTSEKTPGTPRCVVARGVQEPELPPASGSPEDVLPDDEYAVHLGPGSREFLNIVQHPDDRLRP